MQKNLKLIQSVTNSFTKQFGRHPEIISLAPGRINIIGEHTDYNNGLSMPAAINRYVCAAISQSLDTNLSILSIDYDEVFEITPGSECNSSSNWLKIATSVFHTLRSEFNIKCGANIAVGGDIPIGCGLSSSTAFVVSITTALCKLCGIEVNDKDLAHLCHRIENYGLGIGTGLLDQYSVVLSKKKHAMMIDFNDKTIEHIPISLDGCSWVIINSGVKRELASSAYADRVRECSQGFEILKKEYNIDSLREMDISMLGSIDNTSVHYKRLLHFLDENKRVESIKGHLEDSNYIEVGEILQASHNSLKDLYEVSCDEIDFIIKISSEYIGWHGGRIIGGGFGGCSIHLIDNDSVEGFIAHVTQAYIEEYHIKPDVIDINFSSGSYAFDL